MKLEEYHEFLRSCPWGERPLIVESDEKGFSSKSDKTFKNMRRIERNPFDQVALNDRSVGRKKYEISWLGAEMKTDKNFVKIWNKMKRDPDVSCKISGNNVDGFIITVGRSLPQF